MQQRVWADAIRTQPEHMALAFGVFRGIVDWNKNIKYRQPHPSSELHCQE